MACTVVFVPAISTLGWGNTLRGTSSNNLTDVYKRTVLDCSVTSVYGVAERRPEEFAPSSRFNERCSNEQRIVRRILVLKSVENMLTLLGAGSGQRRRRAPDRPRSKAGVVGGSRRPRGDASDPAVRVSTLAVRSRRNRRPLPHGNAFACVTGTE